jgi:transcription initiation factor TFIIB
VSSLWGPLVTDLQRGEVVCMQCGLAVSESIIDTGPEWRVYKPEDVKRVRAAPLKLVVKTDMAVKLEHGERWLKLARLHKEALNSREWRLAAVKSEIRRIKECAGLPQHVAKEAEALVKRYFDLVAGFPPEAAAVAVLWTAAKTAGAPRPLGDFLKCSKADAQKVWRAAGVYVARVKSGGSYVVYHDVLFLLVADGTARGYVAGLPDPAFLLERLLACLEK